MARHGQGREMKNVASVWFSAGRKAMDGAQALLWWLMDDPQLGRAARRAIQSGAPVISPVVLWEITIKTGLGKLNANTAEICTAVTEQGFERIGFTDQQMIDVAALPHHHRDPFDRMLIVQASREEIPVLTSDRKFSDYEVETIDART